MVLIEWAKGLLKRYFGNSMLSLFPSVGSYLENLDLSICEYIVQVMDVIRRWHGVRKISIVAHSLGGLVARYAIGRLYRLSAKTSSASIPNGEGNISIPHGNQFYEASVGGLEPINFVTFATPHLGSRGHKQVSIISLHHNLFLGCCILGAFWLSLVIDISNSILFYF